MSEVTLEEVLKAREERVVRQQEALRKYGKPLVCFTMNIAGPVKINEETAYAFQVGSVRLIEGLKTMGFRLLEKLDLSSGAGFGMLLAVDAEASALKHLCVSLENLDALGRLFDMDVIAENGCKLDRVHERSCLVCGQVGRGCASRRIHPVEEIQQVTWQIIRSHRMQAESEEIAKLAVQSLLDEVCVTPKPGLVDRQDQGSHTDMDIFTFNASAAALAPYFRKCYLAGIQDQGESEETAFLHLQSLGIEAERVMRLATGNVNTHKGAIFTLGIMCGAAGRCGKHDLEIWMDTCARLAAIKRGPGVRAEVGEGLPSVRKIGLPVFAKARISGLSFNGQCLMVLLHLLSEVRDTNMIARGGEETADASRNAARKMIETLDGRVSEEKLLAVMNELNEQYISRHLSPGGCADLLAATLLADRWLIGKYASKG